MTLPGGYRALVYLTLATAYPVVVWGGVVRVTGSGLGCPDWPLCPAGLLPAPELPSQIEWLHRVLATLNGLTLAALALWTLLRFRSERLVLGLVLAAIPLFLLQAILGAVTVVLELPETWVTLHLANAELLLALLTALAVVVRWPTVALRRKASPWTWLTLAAVVGTFLLLLSGAYVRGDHATAACTTWPLCDSGIPPTGAPAVHMLHRYVAGIVGLVVIAACVGAWRHRREAPGLGGAAAATLGLFLLQVAIGALNPLTGFSPWALGAHPAAASAVWSATVALAVLAWRPVDSREAVATARDVVALTKPAIMSLLLLTALGGMFLAERGIPPAGLIVVTMLGGAAASGGASALNHYFDRDIDERMRRTRGRPLPGARISGATAVGFGVALNVFAFALLATFVNLLAAALALAGTLFYIGVYTLWLKRTTVQNIVIGGAAGAIPPLVGWAAVAGSLDLPAWLLFAIIFFWTPAHFWALALLIRDDYERAEIPMLPVVQGEVATGWNILLYAASLVPITALLFIIGAAGVIYLAAALVLGGVFVAFAVRLLRAVESRRRAMARGVYLYSLLYLALLFVAVMVDSAVRL